MERSELEAKLEQHALWLTGSGGCRADLSGANLSDVTMAWASHALISEILWRAADTEARQMLAAFVGRQTGWCWDKWETFAHPEKEWALSVLRPLVKDGGGAPEMLR